MAGEPVEVQVKDLVTVSNMRLVMYREAIKT